MKPIMFLHDDGTKSVFFQKFVHTITTKPCLGVYPKYPNRPSTPYSKLKTRFMAQVGWVYLDDFGGRHRIGIYHGDRTGHLLLHCDLRVVQVDFSVKETRTYSFFVEDELCEVQVVKEKEGFSYGFEVNKKVDTPRNRLRRADERRNRFYIALVVSGLILTITAAFLGLRWWGQRQMQERLAGTSLSGDLSAENQLLLNAAGQASVAQLFVLEEGLQRSVFYGFATAENDQISGRFRAPDTGLIILPNGFPLNDRDAFAVRYLPADPQVHQVDFFQPTAATLAGYLEAARRAEAGAHPEATPGHSLCLAERTLEQKGWERLADLIFQATPPFQNPKNNRDTYLRLVREPGFAQLVAKTCWDK